MEFEAGHLYHIFNRGNNSQQVFFTRDNYLYFLKKIRIYLTPYVDIVAWCLMPNHFHLMVYVNQVDIPERVSRFTERVTTLNQGNAVLHLHDSFENSHPLSKPRSLNNSLGIILRSYARSIQKQQGITGSLFQSRTKAVCLTLPPDGTPTLFQTRFGEIVNLDIPEKDYPQVCFNYIHSNPVNAGLVKLPEQWEFSSACDYTGLRKGKLIHKNRCVEFGLQYY